MKVLERSQQISHCKSMWIFYDAQGKLTPHSEAGSSLNSNSSKLLSLTLLPARMKKIQSKVKAQEWSQLCYIIHQFLRCSRSANSLIGDGILTKFKLIRAFIVVLLICKNEYGLFKFESTRVTQVNRMSRSRRVLAIGGKHCDCGWTGSVFIRFYFL